jgi:hypothetical protein
MLLRRAFILGAMCFGSTALAQVDVQVGSVQVRVRYNGQTPSSLGAACNFNHSIGGRFLGNLCDEQVTPNIAVGTYTVRLGYAFGSGDLVAPANVTIQPGATAQVTFEVAGAVGIAEGSVTLNGQLPGSGTGVCGTTNGKACQTVSSANNQFRLLLPAGSGNGQVWGSGCECITLKSFTFSVAAGAVTQVGTIDAQFGSLEVRVRYMGQLPSSLGAACMFNHTLGSRFLGNLCDSQTTGGVLAGTYTLRLGYAFGNGDIVPSQSVTIQPGATTVATFEVGGATGLVEGLVQLSGAPPGPGYGVCGTTNGKACQPVTNTAGQFKLLLPAGSGNGFVWGSGCECITVATFPFTVTAGATTSIGTVGTQSPGSLQVKVTYKGLPPSATGAGCMFNHELAGHGFLGNLCDEATTGNIKPGNYTLRLGYAFGGYLLSPVPVSITSGAKTTVTFEVGGVVGVVKGEVLVNGQPPQSGYGVCGTTNGKSCQPFSAGSGKFKLLLPAGSGTGIVWGSSCECITVGTFAFSVVAGQETDIGNPLDSTPPTTTAGNVPSGWSNAPVTVTLNAQDNTGGSGVKQVSYSLSGAQTGSATVPGATANIAITANGTTTITYFATDNANNVESTKTAVVRVDTVKPVVLVPASPVVVDAVLNATGAVAVYSASATDNLTPSPQLVCAPLSGGTFALGSTTVTCTATDLAGNAQTASFTVVVRSPSQQTQDLKTLLSQMQLGNQYNPLSKKLDNALASLNKGNSGAACNELGAFINHVQAQSGKQISAADAAVLVQKAQQIKANLGC